MPDPVLTANLVSLRRAFDTRFPHRKKDSDGWIGDNAHKLSVSGHNPDDTAGSLAEYNDHDGRPEVRALDVDRNLEDDDVTMYDVVQHVINRPGVGTILWYVIYNHRIYRSITGFAPEVYDGPNPHTEHAHFSGARNQIADGTNFNWHFEKIGAHPVNDVEDTVTTMLWKIAHVNRGDDEYKSQTPDTQKAWRNLRDLVREVIVDAIDHSSRA